MVLAATVLGCAPLPRAGGPPDLPVIDLPHLEERALLLLLADRRIYEPFTVEKSLGGDAALRELLARHLGWTGRPESRPVLEGLLLDEEGAVRRAAAFALGVLGEEGSAPALLRLAATGSREEAVLAVEALGKLDTPLVEVLKALTPLPEAERWARLVPHLYRFEGEALVPLAARALEDTTAEVHARAAYALSREPRPEALPLLRRLAADPDPRLRGWAARALGMVGERSDLDRLEPLLAGAEAGPAVQALRAGRRLVAEGKAAAPESWRARLLRLVEDERAGVRLTALEVAGAWLLDEELGEILLARQAGGSARERELALLALAEGRHPRAGYLVAAAAGSPEWTLRARAAEAAGRLGDEPTLARLAADPVAAVRAAVLSARLSAGEGAGETDGSRERSAPAAAALADPDPAVRATALDWLAEHPVLPFEDLEAALARASGDRIAESRTSAVAALAARGASEPLERGSVVRVLERIAEDREFLTRRAAIEGLVRLGRPRPALGAVGAGKGGQVYREIVQRTSAERRVEIRTARGAIRLRLACPVAPLTCLNFLQLAAQGFYDGLAFHRVVPDFVVQGGDPRGDGWGGPGYALRDEINPQRFERGTLGMALAGPDTGGSQFFITLSEQPHLDGGFTAFGRVESGWEALDALEQGDRIEEVAEVR